jgi:hypothetical protein
MYLKSTESLNHTQPVLPRASKAQPAARREIESSSLTAEEIRRIVLDVLG